MKKPTNLKYLDLHPPSLAEWERTTITRGKRLTWLVITALVLAATAASLYPFH